MLQFAFFGKTTVHGVVAEHKNWLYTIVGSSPGRVVIFRILAIPIATSTPFSGYRCIECCKFKCHYQYWMNIATYRSVYLCVLFFPAFQYVRRPKSY